MDSIGDDTGGDADTPLVKKLEIGTPSAGQYAVQIVGTGNGEYTLWFSGFDNNGNSSTQTITGTVTKGQIVGYQTTYSPSPGSQIMATPATFVPTSGTACNGVYHGLFTGNLTISSGQQCTFMGGGVTGNVMLTGGSLVLNNAAISQNVQINGGGTFSLGQSTTIMGNLEIQNIPAGSMQNQACGTTVTGNLQVHHNGQPVTIGSASMASCPGNVIDGNLEIFNKSASTTIFGNNVAGNLDDHNNTAATQVFRNTVGNNSSAKTTPPSLAALTQQSKNKDSARASSLCGIHGLGTHQSDPAECHNDELKPRQRSG